MSGRDLIQKDLMASPNVLLMFLTSALMLKIEKFNFCFHLSENLDFKRMCDCNKI